MSEPTSQPVEKNIIATLIRLMMLGAVLAMSYVILKACSTPKMGIEKFSEGSLKKLVVLEAAPNAPAAVFFDGDGQEVSLKDKRGRVVLLNIWATWCAPCLAEIPSLNALQAGYDKDVFEVIAVSVDRDAEDARAFLAKVGANNLALYSDKTYAIAQQSQAKGLPVSILYDKAGREIARLTGEADWNSAEARSLIDSALER